MGDQAWQLFDDLKKNGMVVSGPNAQAVTPVMQGAKAAVFGAVDYVSYGNIQQGESLKVIFPASGTVIAPRPMMILKTSQHADDAKAFIDYVLSPEGQARVADAWLMPARRDVAAKTSVTGTRSKVLPTTSEGSSEAPCSPASVSCTRSNCSCSSGAAAGGDPSASGTGCETNIPFRRDPCRPGDAGRVTVSVYSAAGDFSPFLAPVRSGTPLAAFRRCWPILSCRRCSAVRCGSPPAWRWSA